MVEQQSTMALNIKNAEAHGLAAELARLRGVSVTQAVTDALRGELERERARKKRTGLASELVRIGKRCAEHMTGPVSSAEHGAMLYNQHGLPK